MSFSTYTAGGILLCALIGALTNQHYSWIALGVAAFGSWLPLVEEAPLRPAWPCLSGRQAAGRPPASWLPHWYERPWLTHSLLGLTICALLMSPLLVFHQSVFWTTLLIGYTGHLLLDAGSDRGVLLFYPSRVRAVIPRHPLSRIPPGSPRELLLRRWLVGLLVVALPLNAIGLRGLLHQLLPVIQFAVEDSQEYATEGHRVFADFTGRFTTSQRPIAGRWEVLETIARTSVLAEDPEGRRYTLGTHPHDTIQILRIRARKGPPLDVELQTVHLHEQLLGDLVPLIPAAGRTYLIGSVKTPQTLQPHIAVEQFQSVQAGHGQVDLRYATVQDLTDPRLLGLYVTEGEVVLRTLRDSGPRSAAGGASNPSWRVAAAPARPGAIKPGRASGSGTTNPFWRVVPNRTITLIVHHLAGFQELLVHEGQSVRAGQLLVDLRTYRTGLEEDLRVAQAEATAANVLVLSLELKQEQARSLRATEDVLMGAHRDLTTWHAAEAQTLARAQAGAEIARAKLTRLEQALAATTIRAPASGRFLHVQFHFATSIATLYLRADD